MLSINIARKAAFREQARSQFVTVSFAREGTMLKFIWHWAVVAPADVVAKLTAIAVTALPLVAAVATWILVRSLFDGGGRAKQTAVVTYAWIAAIYVAVISLSTIA